MAIDAKDLTGSSYPDDKIEEIRGPVHRPQRAQTSSEPALLSLFRRHAKRNPDEIATQPSVFDDPKEAQYHQPHPRYENLHRFDPDFTWTWGQEASLIWKINWRISLWAWIVFLALNLDNACLIQAQADNFLKDLKLNTNDYNLGNTTYRLAFLLTEVPSQLISKRFGPDRWIPVLMILWGIVSASQLFLAGRTSFLVTRAIIGFLQGGFIPDIVLYLSYYFKGNELPLRMAVLWTADRCKDIVSPLLAFGILRLRGHVHAYEGGWRWLFLVEGLINVVIGVASFFMMAPSPTQTKAWWRPKGWFNETEEKILVNRILRDDPSKGDMHNRQAINPRLIWKAFCDFDLWPIYIIGILFSIPVGPPKQYLTLSLRGLGFSTFETNLLSIPPQVFTSITMLLLTYASEKLNQRAYLGLFNQLWYLPCLISLSVLPYHTTVAKHKWSTYALITVLLSYPSPHPMQVAWCSRNSNSVRTRAISAALYNMAVQLSVIISSNVYRDDDKPEYRRGNRVLVAITCLNIVLYAATKAYYVWRNRSKAKRWDAMSEEERLRYLNGATDLGNRRLDYRFVS